MEPELSLHLERIRRSPNHPDVFQAARAALRLHGVDHFSYTQSIWLARCHSHLPTYTCMPRAWLNQRGWAHALHSDAVVHHCWHSAHALRQAEPAGDEWWAQGLSDTAGVSARGMLVLFRSAGHPAARPMQEIEPRLQHLAQAIHDRISRLSVQQLTLRERDVLRWSAAGKTIADIADILSVSGNTVKFHLKNASIKLDACNKTAAAVKAALLGLL